MRGLLLAVGTTLVVVGFVALAQTSRRLPGPAFRPVVSAWPTSSVELVVTAFPAAPVKASDLDLVTVERVVDGDTIQIESGEKVRYIGVNTPEAVDPRRRVQCFGKEASEFNRNLVAGRRVRLVKDVSERDKYGRLLRYVYLEDGTFVNLKIIQTGFAYVATFPPDVKYSQMFVEAARKAREEGRGLWQACR